MRLEVQDTPAMHESSGSNVVEPDDVRIRLSVSLVAASILATMLAMPLPIGAQENPLSLDPKKGTLEGSPVDNLPEYIRLLDIRLPDGGKPMRPDWSHDGERLVLLDAPIGDVWEYELTTGAIRNLTETFLSGGVLRAHHLTNPYDEDLVYLMGGERSRVEVSSFPRAGKRIIFSASGIWQVMSSTSSR